MKEIYMHPIGRRVAGKRVEQSLTQQALANKAQVTQRTIATIETGQRTGISLGTMVAVSEALGVSLDYLVFGKGSDERRHV